MTIALFKQNTDIALQVAKAAKERKMHLARYSTSSRMGGFMGEVRYAAYRGSSRPYGTRSPLVAYYRSTAFQKRYKPSIVGERRALTALLQDLR